MQPIWQLTLAIFAPLLFGLLGLLVPRKIIGLRVFLTALGPLSALTLIANYITNHGVDHAPWFQPWMQAFQLNLQLNADKLGLFFALLVSSIGLLIVLYARAYFGRDHDGLFRFYPTLMLFMTAMLGVAFADNFMLLMLFWEMTSISSFLLIGWERDIPQAVKKAMQAFIVTGGGGLAMLGGLILMGVHTGYWSFSELLANQSTLPLGPVMTTAFIMVFAGAAAKSAQFPLHFWLPGAMAAPTPVSAYLHSATMVKAGVYLVGRMWPIFALILPIWPQLIIPLGAITMLYGAFIAIQKTDLKQIFAYTTVSQLGLLMCMYGLAAFQVATGGDAHAAATLLASTASHDPQIIGHALAAAKAATEPNLIWDVTQIFNHALYKAPLFILAGAIGHVAATRELPQLKGFMWRGRTPAIMTTILLLAAYGLAAGPFTISFTAKEMFFYQIAHAFEAAQQNPWFYLLIGAGIATGMFNVAIFIRLASTLLSPKQYVPKRTEVDHAHADHAHETGIWPAFLWIPGAIIVSFQYIGGIIPGAYDKLFGWLEATPNYFDHFPLVFDAHPGMPLYMSLAAIGLGITLGFAPVLRKVYNDPFDKAYPGFYTLVTQKLGPKAFGLVQTGHAGWYVTSISISIVALFVWSVWGNLDTLTWPAEAKFEPFGDLLPGYLITAIVCLSAILMPIVQNRMTRVLVLGVCGFSVTSVYYLYNAPDLALTQISIEIVSLVLFLLVLSMLPRQVKGKAKWVGGRILISLAVGGVMFWLTLTSSVGQQAPLRYFGHDFANLGDFFLRNSQHAVDMEHLQSSQLTSGVVDISPNMQQSTLHHGGGGNNVVNVILVDFRGFDTMGEITVLGLAALGVWMLLRRKQGQLSPKERLEESERGLAAAGGMQIDIPEPTGGYDPEDETLKQIRERSNQS